MSSDTQSAVDLNENRGSATVRGRWGFVGVSVSHVVFHAQSVVVENVLPIYFPLGIPTRCKISKTPDNHTKKPAVSSVLFIGHEDVIVVI